jgi:DNA polymerase
MGEAPGRDEDEQGHPFVGRAGEALNTVLKETSISRVGNWVTNRILCRPPNNNFSHEDAKKAVRYCKVGLYDELEFLKQKGYTVIVPLGNNALKAFGIDGIGKHKNKAIIDDDFGYQLFPMYHPSYIIRNVGVLKEEKLQGSIVWEEWKEGFLKLKELISDT